MSAQAAMAASKTIDVPGLGAVPLDPSPGQAKRMLQRGHSYVASVNLAATGMSAQNGLLQTYAGFGLYLMHQSPPNTILQVAFDQDFGRTAVMRRGSLHHPGPVSPPRSPAHFSQFWAKVVQSGDTSGTAYFLVLGSPEALYFEDPRAVAYRPSATTTNVGSTIATVLAATEILTVRSPRLWVENNGATALVSAPIEISPDGTVWEQILSGTFDVLAASTPLSTSLPDGIRQLRMRAAVASSSTALSVYVTGTMG